MTDVELAGMTYERYLVLKRDLEVIQGSCAERFIKAKLQAFWDTGHKHLDQIRWQQGTPGFNDGDPCVFRVLEASFHLQVLPEYLPQWPDRQHVLDSMGDFDAGFYTEHGLFHGSDEFVEKDFTPAQKVALEAFIRFQESNSVLFLAAFGDGYVITATKEGFTKRQWRD